MNTLQYITDNDGNKISVVLPIKHYEKLIRELEDLDDVRLYDEAKMEGGESIPFNDYLKKREARKNG